MEKDGEPLEVQPIRTLDTGITYRRGFPGLVPELEEREAAKFNGFNWRQWLSLPLHDRADGVACFRISKMIEYHHQKAIERETRRKTRTTAPAASPRVNRPRGRR